MSFNTAIAINPCTERLICAFVSEWLFPGIMWFPFMMNEHIACFVKWLNFSVHLMFSEFLRYNQHSQHSLHLPSSAWHFGAKGAWSFRSINFFQPRCDALENKQSESQNDTACQHQFVSEACAKALEEGMRFELCIACRFGMAFMILALHEDQPGYQLPLRLILFCTAKAHTA